MAADDDLLSIQENLEKFIPDCVHYSTTKGCKEGASCKFAHRKGGDDERGRDRRHIMYPHIAVNLTKKGIWEAFARPPLDKALDGWWTSFEGNRICFSAESEGD